MHTRAAATCGIMLDRMQCRAVRDVPVMNWRFIKRANARSSAATLPQKKMNWSAGVRALENACRFLTSVRGISVRARAFVCVCLYVCDLN